MCLFTHVCVLCILIHYFCLDGKRKKGDVFFQVLTGLQILLIMRCNLIHKKSRLEHFHTHMHTHTHTHTHTYIYIQLILWITQDTSVAKTSTQLKPAFWEGDKNVLAHTMENPWGIHPQEQWDPYVQKKKKERNENSHCISLFCVPLCWLKSQVLSKKWQPANQDYIPVAQKLYLEKRAFFSVI